MCSEEMYGTRSNTGDFLRPEGRVLGYTRK